MDKTIHYNRKVEKYVNTHNFDSIDFQPFQTFKWFQLLLAPILAWLIYQGLLFGLHYFLGKNQNLFNYLAGLTNLIVFGGFFWIFGLRSRKLDLLITGIKPIEFGSKKWILLAILSATALLIVRIVLMVILIDLFPGISPPSGTSPDPSPFLLDFTVTALMVPIGEELFFRAFLFKGLCQKTHVWIAIIVSSIFFGVAHFSILQGISAFIFGIVVAYFYHRSESIYIPILMHMINNGLLTILLHFF
ncbi:lysostaphin resistance A-like protein [Candidatus Lokiarchaeum ossiferum]|uniref:lysostaphin resistance A-like protein n=1 Tax=Candidatus Lokiarchaeum ossiferum TaxID=2951803 RepID=UPI00352E5ED9